MINSIKALGVTLRAMGRKRVTAEYPKEHLPVDNRYMGFPALLWDFQRDEPFCTGCMVCVRYCPTQCMSAEMHDNPKFTAGDSHRRKIIQTFEINLNRCILCGICVDVCNFDAIEMSHEHELAGRGRNDQRVDLGELLKMGKKYQDETGWKQSKPNAPSPKEKEAAAQKSEASKPVPEPVEGPARGGTSPAEASTSSATGRAPDPETHRPEAPRRVEGTTSATGSRSVPEPVEGQSRAGRTSSAQPEHLGEPVEGSNRKETSREGDDKEAAAG